MTTGVPIENGKTSSTKLLSQPGGSILQQSQQAAESIISGHQSTYNQNNLTTHYQNLNNYQAMIDNLEQQQQQRPP